MIRRNRPGRYPSATAGPILGILEVPVRTCDQCSVEYVDWWADEPLWAFVIGRHEGSLCFDCFRIRCQEKGIVTVVVDSMARFERSGRTREE